MSKIFGLIRNELIKQYKKVSVKIILILVLIASLAAPFVLKALKSDDTLKWDIDNYENNISYLNMDLQAIDSSAKNADINKKVIQAEIDSYNLRIDNGIGWNDWRSDIIIDNLYKETLLIILEGIKSGLTFEELMNNIYQVDAMEVENYYKKSKEEIQKEIDRLTLEVASEKKRIVENDYLGYLQGVIKETEKELEEEKKLLVALESELAKSVGNKALEQNIDNQKNRIASKEELLKAYRYKYDNNVVYDSKDWRHRTVEDIKISIDGKYEDLLSEEEFKQNYTYEINANGYTYEKYKADREERMNEATKSIALDWYSLENNIPRVQFIDDARNSLNSTYLVYISIAILLCIIIGGGIVSSEYSTGTIRLLMIRPVLRWKILLSKLIAVFIIGYGAIFLLFALNIVSSGMAHGFEGLSVPILYIKDGVIVQGSFILSLIPKLMFASISLVFIISAVFFLSTVLRNTAVAVGITMAGYFASMPATQIAANQGFTWIDKTFLPYVNLSTYVSGNSWVIDMLKQCGLKLDPVFGAIYLLAISFILITIAFIVFNKRDVTN